MRSTRDEPATPHHKTDDELLRALANDQANGLAALYDRYASLVYGLALAVLSSPQEAEDLTQEIFLALCNRCDYDPARGTLSGFLVTMTRSRAIDRLRSRGRKVRLLEQWGHMTVPNATPTAPHDEVSLAETSERIRNALAKLPPNQRRVLEMAYYKGLSQTEIAAELDIPLGTVKTWARKGLFSLKDSLRGLAA